MFVYMHISPWQADYLRVFSWFKPDPTKTEGGVSSSWHTKRRVSPCTHRSCLELRSAWNHVTGVTIVILHAYHHPPSPPSPLQPPFTHPSRVQLSSEHTLLRRCEDFQRRFIELLRLLTSTAKYCRGISRLCCGHWKLSVVGNLRGEGSTVRRKKRRSTEIKVVQVLGN